MKKVITFSCPTCEVKIPVFSIGLTDEGFIILLGTCLQCEENYRFNVETVLAELYRNTINRYVH